MKFVSFQIKRLPAEVLKILNLPVPTYDSSSESEYSVVNILEQFFGVDLFTLAFIASLYFIASVALVSIVIPNLYFRSRSYFRFRFYQIGFFTE